MGSDNRDTTRAGGGGSPDGRSPLLRRRIVARRMSLTKANVCRFALALPFALIAIVAVVLHAVLPPMILGRIGDSLNADISAASWEIGLDRVVLNDVTVRSRAVEGRPGEIMVVRRMVAEVVPTKLLGGVGAVRTLKLEQPTLRVSIDATATERPRTNLTGLRLASGDGGPGAPRLPGVYVTDGAVDWGEHRGDSFRSLRLIRLEGDLQPMAHADGPALALALREVLDAAGQQADRATGGIVVEGELTPDRVTVTLNNFLFHEWLPRAAPATVRPLLEDLDIEGNVSEITIAMTGPGYERITASAELDGVAVTLPLVPEGQEEEGLRLTGTSGRLRIEQRQFLAEVAGELAGVPYAVELGADVRDLIEGRGTEASMPYSATVTVDEFNFGENSNFLPFLPDAVRDVLARFADRNQIGAISPTANLSAEVRLAGQITGSDEGFGAAVPRTYRGLVRISGGATAFYEFPYQFEDVRGEIEFDQDRLSIRSLFGVAETGAVLSASGMVSPLGSEAGFDLEIEVFDVPIDETLRGAMQPEHREAVAQILSVPQFEQLKARGLVVRPGHRAEAVRAIEQTERRLRELTALGDPAAGETLETVRAMARQLAVAPEAELGGTLGLLLTLQKPAGGDGEWDINIRADVADALLVPEIFPLPIRVRDLAVQIADERVTVTRGTAVPVNGLSGQIEGTVDVSGPTPKPNLWFRADRLRAGELLNYAIGPEGRDPARRDAAGIVRALGLHGDTDAVGTITPGQGDDIGFAVSLGLGRVGMLAGPLTDRSPLILEQASGVIEVTHQGLTIDTDALFTDISGDEALERPTEVQLAVDLDWSDPTRELVSTSVIGAQGLRASAPIEQIVHLFSEQSAAALIGLRDEFDPIGMCDGEVRIVTDGTGVGETTVELMGLNNVSVTQFGGRIECEEPAGTVVVRGRRDGRAHLELHRLRGDLSFADEPAGRFVADGSLELSPPDGVARRSRELRVGYTGGRFESALARAFVMTQIGGRFAEDYVSHDARGAFDLDALLVPRVTPPDRTTKPGIEQIARPTYTLHPEWGEINRRGRDIRIDLAEGAIVTVPGQTRFEGLRADGPGFSVALDGSLTPDGQGGAGIDLRLEAEAAALTPDVRAVLIDELVANLEKLEVSSDDRISLTGGRLRVESTLGVNGPEVGSRFEGILRAENASMMLGSPVDGIAGTMNVWMQRGPSDEAPDLRLLARADRARLAGIELRDARVRVEADADHPGRLVVPVFSAEGRSGGRIWGESLIVPDESGGAPRYELDASFTGLRLAAVQDELEAAGLGLGGADELASPRPDTGAQIQGNAVLAGVIERDETRRGRVSLRIAGGQLWRFPLLSRLIEIKALQPPTGEALDLASADLVVDGTTVTCEYLSVESRTVEVFGYGLVTLPEFGLDFMLYTRSKSPWPVVSRIADALFDEFGKVSITGTAKAPRSSVLAFPSGQRLLGSILSPSSSEESRRLDQVRRHAFEIREARSRYRDVERPARAATISAEPNPSNERLSQAQEPR